MRREDDVCEAAFMFPHDRAFVLKLHADAHRRALARGDPSPPCIYCGRDYEWHVEAGTYEPGHHGLVPVVQKEGWDDS